MAVRGCWPSMETANGGAWVLTKHGDSHVSEWAMTKHGDSHGGGWVLAKLFCHADEPESWMVVGQEVRQ